MSKIPIVGGGKRLWNSDSGPVLDSESHHFKYEESQRDTKWLVYWGGWSYIVGRVVGRRGLDAQGYLTAVNCGGTTGTICKWGWVSTQYEKRHPCPAVSYKERTLRLGIRRISGERNRSSSHFLRGHVRIMRRGFLAGKGGGGVAQPPERNWQVAHKKFFVRFLHPCGAAGLAERGASLGGGDQRRGKGGGIVGSGKISMVWKGSAYMPFRGGFLLENQGGR